MADPTSSKHVYIVHGYGATPANHWFGWLQKRLDADGITSDILEMPTPLSPNLQEWLEHLSSKAKLLNQDTYFVAHSLGCVSLLKYLLSARPQEPLGGLVLVSGFTKPLPGLPMLDEFTQDQINYSEAAALAPKRAVIASKDDAIVPVALSKELAQVIHADFHEVEHSGHFLDSDGFTTLPIAYDVLRDMMGHGAK
ncbi:RBBP9/YdeN family alpha/beta hydrolase [Paenibacillus sp. FSL R7-0179]|uniref:RBBP9/YdeN family alpha/beta hydrolase n=1 Tax=Paenibacillus sp. FSL R7-0179 TaxID=2921672 RepID=UPI0030F63E84